LRETDWTVFFLYEKEGAMTFFDSGADTDQESDNMHCVLNVVKTKIGGIPLLFMVCSVVIICIAYCYRLFLSSFLILLPLLFLRVNQYIYILSKFKYSYSVFSQTLRCEGALSCVQSLS
jgi:hypothetical protein